MFKFPNSKKRWIRERMKERDVECPTCFRINHINFNEERIMKLKAEYARLRDLRDATLDEYKSLCRLIELKNDGVGEDFELVDRIRRDAEKMLDKIKRIKIKTE